MLLCTWFWRQGSTFEKSLGDGTPACTFLQLSMQQKACSVFFFKKKKEQKNQEFLFSRHVFTYGFFLTKDTEFFLHSAKMVESIFFLSFYGIRK